MPTVSTEYQILYGTFVGGEVEIPLTDRVTASYTLPYNLLGIIAVEDTLLYGIQGYDLVRNEVTVAMGARVIAEHEIPLQLIGRIGGEVEVPINYTQDVASEYTLQYGILDYVPVATEVRIPMLFSDPVVVTDNTEAIVELGGQIIGVEEVEVRTDEGSYVWSASLKLTRVDDFDAFYQDAPFTVTLGSDVYHFITDTKELTRDQPAGISPVVQGVSKSIQFDFPRADPYSVEHSEDTLASQIAADAVGALTWQAVDWTLPAYRVSVSGVSPISLVKNLAAAAGAVVESDLGGNLVVRPKFPVTVPEYPTATPDHTLTETSEIIALTERFDFDQIVNRIRLMDQDADYTDRLEWLGDETQYNQGVVRAYPGPWREAVLVGSTGPIILSGGGKTSRTIEEEDGRGELIEIVGGQGQTTYPVWGIVGTDWVSASLGGLTWTPGSTTISTTNTDPGYGLVRLRYVTNYFEYSADFRLELDAQFLMYDTSV